MRLIFLGANRTYEHFRVYPAGGDLSPPPPTLFLQRNDSKPGASFIKTLHLGEVDTFPSVKALLLCTGMGDHKYFGVLVPFPIPSPWI